MSKESHFRGEEIPKSPLEEAIETLRPIAERLDHGEILDTVTHESAIQTLEKLGELRNVIRSPKNLSEALEMVAAESSTQTVEALKILQEGFDKAVPLDAVSDWSKVEYTPTQWIMPDWLPAGRVTMLVGPGAAGKTHIGMQVATAVAARWPHAFLATAGAKVISPQIDSALAGPPVVWATWETQIGDFQKRLRGITMGDLQVMDGRLHYVNMRANGALWGPPTGAHVSTAAEMLAAGERLLRYAEAVKPRVLVIDPLAAAFMSNENDRGLVRAFMTRLAEWAAQNDCAVLIIAHPPKNRGGQGKAPTIDDLYSGSTDWPASVQSFWAYSKCGCEVNEEDGDEDPPPCPYRRLGNAKINEGPERRDPLWFIWDSNHGTFCLSQHTPKRKGRSGNNSRGRRTGAASQSNSNKSEFDGF